LPVAVEKCTGIEPQSWKDGRTMESIRTDGTLREDASLLAVPEDFVRVHRANEILHDPGLLIVGQFRAEIDVPRRLRNLDDELRSPVNVPTFVRSPATSFRQDEEQSIRLRLALPAQDRRRIVEHLNPRSFLGVIVESDNHSNPGHSMQHTDMFWHVNNSIN
jgi:hypothetical protein